MSISKCINDILNRLKDGREYKYQSIENDANELDFAFAIQRMSQENLIDD
jgi:hypothetical protein